MPTGSGDDDVFKQKKKKKGIPGLGVVVGVAMAVAVLWIIENRIVLERECEAELADLYAMQSAAQAVSLKWNEAFPDDAVGYWFDAVKFELLPVDGPKPPASGMGTARPGGGKARFTRDTGVDYDYDERVDYTGKLLRVDVDGGRETAISLTWVEAE